MTVETRTTVELSDIKAIEFECASCKTKLVVQIEKFDSPPINCASCGNGQAWFVANSPDRSDIARLVKTINRFSDHANANFLMRLEVKGVSASHAVSDRA